MSSTPQSKNAHHDKTTVTDNGTTIRFQSGEGSPAGRTGFLMTMTSPPKNNSTVQYKRGHMRTKLTIGMHLKSLKDITLHDPITFIPTRIPAETVWRITEITATVFPHEFPHMVLVCRCKEGTMMFPVTPNALGTAKFSDTFEVL